MKQKTVEVKLKQGLEARPAAMLVRLQASMPAIFIWSLKAEK